MSVKIYLNTSGGLVIEDSDGVVYNPSRGSLGAKCESGRFHLCHSGNGECFKDYSISDVKNSHDEEYGNYDEIMLAIQDFFVNAPSSGGGQVVDMKPNEYLSDIVSKIIEKGDESKKYTINFYQHNDFTNWSNFRKNLLIPKNVTLNFVGNILPFENGIQYPGSWYDEGMFAQTAKPKLFLGFRLTGAGENFRTELTIPKTQIQSFFGGLDDSCCMIDTLAELIPETTGLGSYGLVFCKEDRSLYKKIDGQFRDITTVFNFCSMFCSNFFGSYFMGVKIIDSSFEMSNFSSALMEYSDLSSTSFKNCKFLETNFGDCIMSSASMQGSDMSRSSFFNANSYGVYFTDCNLTKCRFGNTDLQNAYFNGCNLSGIQIENPCNFKGASLYTAYGLPESLNTKAKFITAVGSENVDNTTIWIDGTSILS